MIAIGVLCGIFYNFKLDSFLQNEIFENILSLIDQKMILNTNFYHLIIILFILVSSFMLIGLFPSLFALFYEGFSIGIIVTTFIRQKAIKGMVYAIIYIVCSKLVFIILLLISTIISFRLFKNIISKNNKNNNYYLNLHRYLKRFIFIFLLGTLNEIIFVPLFNKVCCYFSFLII